MALQKLGVQAVIEGLSSFTNGMKKMDQAIEDVGDTSKKSTGVLDKMSIGWGELAAAAGTVTAAIFTAKKVFDFAEEGAQILRLEEAGKSLAKSYGTSMDAIVEAVSKAANGTIADTDIILAANKAMLLGVADTAGEMADLMEVAAVRGRAMGISTSQAFSDIVTGIGRMSPMILDNLGILTGGEKTFEDYAKSIGKTADALSDAEKKQALFNKVISETAPLIEEMGGVTMDAASEFEAANVVIANTTAELKKFAAIGVARAINAIRLLTSEGAKIDEILGKNVKSTIESTDSYEDYKSAIEGLAKASHRITISQSEYNERMEKGGISAHMAERAVVLLTEAEYNHQKQIERNRDVMSEEVELHREAYEAMGATKSKVEELTETEASQEEITKRVNEQYSMLKDLMKVDLTESFTKFQNQVSELNGEISDLERLNYLTEEQKTQLQEARDELDETIKKWQEYTAEVIFNIATQALEQGGLTEEEAKALAKTAESLGLVDRGYAALVESVYDSAEAVQYAGDQSDEFARSMQNLVETLSSATLEADDLAEAIRKIPTTKKITISTSYTGVHLARQYGGMVEQGLPYLVGEKGPELFIPNISGNILSNMMTRVMSQVNPSVTNAQTYQGDNLNLNIYTSAPSENLIADFRMLKAMGSRI